MLVDAEHAFDPAYSKALGVDVENLIVCQPDHGEMALESNIFSLCLCGCVRIHVMCWQYLLCPTAMLMKFIIFMLEIY